MPATTRTGRVAKCSIGEQLTPWFMFVFSARGNVDQGVWLILLHITRSELSVNKIVYSRAIFDCMVYHTSTKSFDTVALQNSAVA